MVPLSKSGLAFGERGFESHPLRRYVKYNIANMISFLYRGEVLEWPIRRAWRARVAFGYRGFESHPLRSDSFSRKPLSPLDFYLVTLSLYPPPLIREKELIV